MPNVIKTCAKCGCRYEYFFDGENYPPCPKCGDDPIGSLRSAEAKDLIAKLHDSRTRHNAAIALGERRVQEAAEPLLAILGNESAKIEVDDGVIIALGLLQEERAVENLISVLFQGKDWRKEPNPWNLRCNYPGRIIEALLRIGTNQALEAVLATNPFDFEIKTLRALGRFPSKNVVVALNEVVLSAGNEENNPEKVKVAIASLSEVGGQLAITTLQAKLSSQNEHIAIAASQALEKLGFTGLFSKEEFSKEKLEAAEQRRKEKESAHQKEVAEKKSKDEAEQKRKIQSNRRMEKRCIQCGKSLKLFQRLLGQQQHRNCVTFSR